MEHTAALKQLLSSPRRIAITMHQKADGDAIGSALGLHHYLTQLGHRSKIVSPTEYPEFLKFLPGTPQVIIGANDADAANWAFEGSDVIFCLDFNALHRINEFEKTVEESEATKVLIDHHLDPVGFEDIRFWDDQASSTAEMVYRLIDEMGDLDRINQDIATCLYTGIMTDTGSFRFNTTTPAVHRIVAQLLETGIIANHIHEEVYANNSESRLRFFGHCFSQCLHVVPEYEAAYFVVPRDVFRKYWVKTGETEGLVNYALDLKGVKLAVLLSEHEELVKLSFRSRGDVAANEFAQEFNGGGHFYAAGGRSKDSLEETEKKLLALLKARHVPLAEPKQV